MQRIDANTLFALVSLREMCSRVGKLIWPDAYLVANFEKLIGHNAPIDIDMIGTAHVNNAVCPLVLHQLCMLGRNLRMVELNRASWLATNGNTLTAQHNRWN